MAELMVVQSSCQKTTPNWNRGFRKYDFN